MKITIYIPEKGKRWGYRKSNGGTKLHANASTLLISIFKDISRLVEKEKITIKVKYGGGTSNETIASQNANYLIYATACFLEDYMTKGLFKKYLKYNKIPGL